VVTFPTLSNFTCGQRVCLWFTPKALNNIVQIKCYGVTLKGLHKLANVAVLPFRVTNTTGQLTQGARRSAATLGFVVERLRRIRQETMKVLTQLEFVSVSELLSPDP
jgi:hypothetical protein